MEVAITLTNSQLNASQIEEILRLSDAGETYSEIARAFGLKHPQQVGVLRKQHGRQPKFIMPPKKSTIPLEEQLAQLKVQAKELEERIAARRVRVEWREDVDDETGTLVITGITTSFRKNGGMTKILNIITARFPQEG